MAITPSFRVFIDDVSVKDLKGNNLAVVGRLRAKIFVGELLEGKVHLRNAELNDVEANLIQYEGEDKLNFAFLLEAFPHKQKQKEKKPKVIPIIVDRIALKNIDFMLWDQNKSDSLKTARHLMDYKHLDIDGVNLEASDFYMLGDSIHANIGHLDATELSGLILRSFQGEASVTSKGIFVDDLLMETNNSRFDMDLHMLWNGFGNFGSFVDSVVFDATIRPSDIMLSDIGFFTEVMYKMPDRVQFEGKFSGPIEHFRVDDFNIGLGKSTQIQGSLSMHPLDFNDGYHEMKINNMRFSYDDLVNFHIPSPTKTIPLPESLRPMGIGRLSIDFKGSYNDFRTSVKLNSGIGDIEANVARSKDSKGSTMFAGNVNADNVKAGTIANATKYVGDLDLNAEFSIKFPEKGNPELSLDGKIGNAQLLGHNIDEIKLDGAMEQNLFQGMVKIDDNDLSLDFNGLIDFQDSKFPKSDFTAIVRNANLSTLNLIKGDSISRISTTIYANMTGFNIDDLEGTLRIDSTLYRDSRGEYFMKDFSASIVNDILMMRRIHLDCDFLDFEMAGKMNFASLKPVFQEYLDTYVNIPLWDKQLADFEASKSNIDHEQDFVVNLLLKDTQTISRLFMPSLKIAKNTSLRGTFTSRTNSLNLTLRSKNISVGDVNFNDLEVKNMNFGKSAITTLSLDEILYSNISATDTMAFSLESFSIVTRMANDTVFTRILWDDKSPDDHNKAAIEAYFHPHEQGGIFSIPKADILINDSLWNVSPNNYINIVDNRQEVSNLMFNHHKQSLRIDGYVPMKQGDTILVQLSDFDISNFDLLILPKGFDIDGYITGDATVSGLKEKPMVLADLNVKQLGVNKEVIGDAVINSSWNNAEKSIGVDLSILNEMRKSLNVNGYYYTERKDDNLDFTVQMDSLSLVAISPFLTNVVSRVQGYGNGLVTVNGTIDKPNIEGSLHIKDGGCKVGYLNTFYTFEPTILIDSKSIKFKDMVLVDTLGNKAMVEGQIKHNMLKDFYLDLRLHPRDFLAMATTSKDNDTFYGSAVANGLVAVKGPFKDILLDIMASTRKGTHITIPLNRTATVKKHDFIVFLDRHANDEDDETHVEEKHEKVKSNFTLNLDVNANEDATMKIILPNDIGTIEASGNGNLKLGSSSNNPFAMYGTYSIHSGKFQLTLMNLVTRLFNLKEGGTITWTGDPTDGRIDATGAYSLKTSIAGLGVEVDSTLNNNVNVECLIHLKGALLNPSITFGLNLPNASEDITQTVYSLLDTTNQAAMTNQALSLLVVGSFVNVGNGSANVNMSSLLFGGMQVDITDHLNLGLRYNSGSIDSYDEYMMSLRTELFENRLTIETNFGVMSSNNSSSNASNLVGEFDFYYKLSEDGRLQAHFYNHSNYNSNLNNFAIDRRAPYTQGLGLSYSRSFDNFRNLFRKNTAKSNQPLIRPKKQENLNDE